MDSPAALEAVNTLALALTAAEADAANEQAVRAVLPLLRAASDSGRVRVVREGLKQLHAAAVKGELAEPGLQQSVQEALRCLAVEAGAASARNQQASKRSSPEDSSCSKRKQQRMAVEAGREPMTIDEIPCQVCGVSEGLDMIVCDWCAASSGHLGCLDFTEVPADSWFCSRDCGGNREAAVVAGEMHGRWVLGKFEGVEEPFWGQLAYVAYGFMKVRYVDGEVYQGVRVAHLLGQEGMVDHQGLFLQPEACTVPAGVLKSFEERGWLL